MAMRLTQDDLNAITGLFHNEMKGLKEDVSVLKEDVSVLKKDVEGLKEEVGVLKEKTDTLEENVRALSLDNENIIKPNIQLLLEVYKPEVERSRKNEEEIGHIKEDVTVLKNVVKDHSMTLAAMGY